MKSFSELTSASQVNNGDLLAISQTSGSGYASKKTTVKDITDKSNLNLAEEYDSTSTYAVDDYVIYESVLYKCIGTTTGTFDSTKWTSVVVTDEMGSGGGGGTGGHTIIDENGNSMTARAGLQFVGGANVSDDSTNNKTIVDLASAGGIDGVFIDAENVIDTNTYRSTLSYTASEDCYFFGLLVAAATSGLASATIDGEQVSNIYNSTNAIIQKDVFVALKKGQTIAISNSANWECTYKVYGIQTGTTHSKFQPVIYSLEEREIGVWTDGKPLYEKTIDFGTLPNASQKAVAHNIANVDKIWIQQSFVTDGNNYWNVNRPNTAVNYSWNGSVNATNVYVEDAVNLSTLTAFITIQYTKTTDVAGSGSWTPQGVPAHHYSTDEQVVGTWNGETLYEKTYFNVSITNQANNLVESNFDSHRVLQNFNISTKGMANTLFNYSSSINDTLFIENGDLKYYVSKTGSWWNALDKVDITIQYTKSS